MGWDTYGQITVAVLTIGAAVLQVQRRGGRRAEIRQDLELLALLPKGSEAHRLMTKHIDSSVTKLIGVESEKRRDWTGVVLAIIFIAGALTAVYYAFQASGLLSVVLWVAAVLVGTIGAAGLAQDVVPRKRDAKGRPIE
ncbi:hypothetical protein [Micromonospora sp. NPDC005299]|uniref:hypothetical protein n=1 Tax=Micromonospora sp. NPDC005299 TaxID=3364231 RepID=UPI00367484DC